jgi:hypothetical protein
MPEKKDKINIRNGESRVTGNSMPEKEDKTNIKNGESRVTGNTIPGFSFLDICFIFFLWYCVACDSGFSILDICFIFFLWHTVACDSRFSIPEKEDKINIKNGES